MEKKKTMKENIKIGLLGIIAIASVVNVFQLSSLGSHGDEVENTINSSAVATNVAGNNQMANIAANPNGTVSTTINPSNDLPPTPTDPNMKTTNLKWGDMVHDFGKVKQNSENKYSFKFTNTGKEPLLITNAVGSCGCTVPDYPKEPVAPGATASIDVVYKPGTQENQQEKTVTVTANTQPMQTTLKIRAFVEK